MKREFVPEYRVKNTLDLDKLKPKLKYLSSVLIEDIGQVVAKSPYGTWEWIGFYDGQYLTKKLDSILKKKSRKI